MKQEQTKSADPVPLLGVEARAVTAGFLSSVLIAGALDPSCVLSGSPSIFTSKDKLLLLLRCLERGDVAHFARWANPHLC